MTAGCVNCKDTNRICLVNFSWNLCTFVNEVSLNENHKLPSGLNSNYQYLFDFNVRYELTVFLIESKLMNNFI